MAKKDASKDKVVPSKSKSGMVGAGIALTVFAYIISLFFMEKSASSARSNLAGGGSQSIQPVLLPGPTTITVTNSWSSPLPLSGTTATGFTWTTGADIKVRVGLEEGGYKECPITSMNGTTGNSLEFQLNKAFNRPVKVTVYQFRNIADRDRWLKEP